MARLARADLTTVLLILTVSQRLWPAVRAERYVPFFNPDCSTTRDCSWTYINRSVNETQDGVSQRQFCELTTSNQDGLTEMCPNPFKPPIQPHLRPGKPQHFRVTDFNKNISSSERPSEVEQYTCVHITFNLDPIAARNVKGLQLLLEPTSIEDLNKNFCVILNFSEMGLNYFAVLDKSEHQVDLTFSCFCGLKPGRIYSVGVRTMPVDIIGSSPYDTVQKIDHTPPGCNDPKKEKDIRCQKTAAARWQPRCVSIKQDTSTPHHKGDYNIVEFSFEAAPDSYCMEAYYVFVYPDVGVAPIKDVRVTLASVNRTCSELNNKSVPFVVIRFNAQNWPSEFYVAIHPVSKLCRNADGTKTQCKYTFTQDFHLIEDPCKSSPCGSEGQCISEEERYKCECAPGDMVWKDTCIVDPCQSGRNVSNPCQHGECSYAPERDNYVCYCDESFLNVEKTCLADPCSVNPETGMTICGAHGHCNRTLAEEVVSHSCICDPGYSVQGKEICQGAAKLEWFVIVLGCIAGLLLFILLVCLGKRVGLFRCKNEEQVAIGNRQHHPPQVTYTVITQPDPSHQMDFEISPRLVLPIFSEDHPRHKDVVLKFCRFLHRHLRCEVSLIDWRSSIGPTVEMWLAKEIEKADIVLLLCSKGTGLKYDARANNEPVSNNSESEYGDVFVKALTLLDDYFGRSNADEKFVVGYFNYSSKDDIPVTFRRFAKYHLMNCIEGLCLRIHGRIRDSPHSSRRVPDLKRYQELEMGGPLYDAIEAMEETIRGDEFWYETNKVELRKAPSFFFDEDSSGQGSDGDNYEELMSQLNNTLPCVRGDEDLFDRSGMHTSNQVKSFSLPLKEFFTTNFESVNDSGYMSPNVV